MGYWTILIVFDVFDFQRIGYHFKREEIELTIMQRINNVFRRATAKWKVRDSSPQNRSVY